MAAERAIRILTQAPMELTGRLADDEAFTDELVEERLSGDGGLMRLA